MWSGCHREQVINLNGTPSTYAIEINHKYITFNKRLINELFFLNHLFSDINCSRKKSYSLSVVISVDQTHAPIAKGKAKLI